MSACSYLRKKVIDLLTNNGVYASPTLFLSLHSSDPGAAGTHAHEIVDAGYARQPLAGVMSAADATTGLCTNTVAINFGPATVQWDVQALGLEDALTSGNMLAPGIPQLPKLIAIGATFQLAPGQLSLRLT